MHKVFAGVVKTAWVAIAGVNLVVGALYGGEAGQIPIERFFGLPKIARPSLSPDGSKVAFLFPLEGRLALGYLDREKKESNLILRGTDESIFRFFWKGNDRIVFMADVDGNESFFIGTTDLTGKNVVRIAESRRHDSLDGTNAYIVSGCINDEDHIVAAGIFTQRDLAPGEFREYDTGVFRIDINDGSREQLYDSFDRREIAYLVDESGNFRGRALAIGKMMQYRVRNGGEEVIVAEFPRHGYAEDFTVWGFDASGRRVFVLSRKEHDRGALRVFDLEKMELSPALFVPEKGEITRLVFNRKRTKLVGIVTEYIKREYHWFDRTRARIQANLEATFPGKMVDVVSTSEDDAVVLCLVHSDRDPGTYYLYDVKAGKIDRLQNLRDLDPEAMRPMEPFSFKARDGLEIHGYMVRPEKTDPIPPLVVLPHGGPFGVRDSWGFDPEVQFLANRGYSVIQVNYRGSGGFGREFINRGRYQWGRAMQDDLTDAVKWAIENGYAAPDKVGIYGASYGGYAALAGLIFTPDLYQCGVNYLGPTDLEITFVSKGQSARAVDFNYRDEWVGPTRESRDEVSPVRHVDKIKAPLFNVYGEKDPRVRIDHWERFEKELKRHGVRYEAMVVAKQGHGFRDERASQSFYARLEAFLAKYLPPATPEGK